MGTPEYYSSEVARRYAAAQRRIRDFGQDAIDGGWGTVPEADTTPVRADAFPRGLGNRAYYVMCEYERRRALRRVVAALIRTGQLGDVTAPPTEITYVVHGPFERDADGTFVVNTVEATPLRLLSRGRGHPFGERRVAL